MTDDSNKTRRTGGNSGNSSPRAAQIIQKREFIDRVLASTGGKKNQIKPVVEATLEELGKAFAAGETLVVPPFGRARVSMKKNIEGGEVINLRVRRRGPQE